MHPTGSSYPEGSIVVGNSLYFKAYDNVNGFELWKSDGTTEGTAIVKNINASDSSYPVSLTAVGSTIYFEADDGINGYELWKSDGTEEGTVLVKDIYVGNYGSVSDLTAVGNTLYFRAQDLEHSSELWKTDGTSSGTVLVDDTYPGDNSSSPSRMTILGDRLLFRADNGVIGGELYSLLVGTETLTPTPTVPQTAGPTRGSSGSSIPQSLQQVQTKSIVSTTPTQTPKVFSVMTRNLKVGQSGNDVKSLQVFLNTNGFPIALTGVGSANKETGLFGGLTRKALIKFQKANGIKPASGNFGPLTRALVLKKMNTTTNATSSTSTATVKN
jgi:ELWxxDGT repeat protein